VLEISPSAAELIRRMTDTVAGINGVRVGLSPVESSNGDIPSATIVIAPASGPVGDDQTVHDDGVVVFVDPEVAPLIDDKRLEVTPAGVDQVRFALTEQRG
jgi:Fe-S cluster assembly iron-binding protein IscA